MLLPWFLPFMTTPILRAQGPMAHTPQYEIVVVPQPQAVSPKAPAIGPGPLATALKASRPKTNRGQQKKGGGKLVVFAKDLAVTGRFLTCHLLCPRLWVFSSSRSVQEYSFTFFLHSRCRLAFLSSFHLHIRVRRCFPLSQICGKTYENTHKRRSSNKHV